MKTSTIHVRVPEDLKKVVQEIAEANGLDISTCIRMFFKHIEMRGTIPLPRLTVNGFTEEEEEEIVRRSRQPMETMEDVDGFIHSLSA